MIGQYLWPGATLLFIAAHAGAQQDPMFGLDEAPGSDTVKAVPVLPGLRPASSTVLSGEELIRRGYRTLGAALADVVGVDLQRTSRAPRYGMRGVPDGLVLIIDGVPYANDGERAVLEVDAGLDLHDVERVEIVRGPVSAVNGVSALSGVVRVTTRRPGLTGARLSLGTSHLGEREIAAGGTLRHGGLFAQAALQHREGPAGVWPLQHVPTRFIRVGRAVLPSTKVNTTVLPDDDAATLARLSAGAGPLSCDLSFSRSDEHVPLSSFSHGLLDEGPQQRRLRERQQLRLMWQDYLGPAHVEISAFGRRHLGTEQIVLYPPRGLFARGGFIEVDSRSDVLGALVRATLPVWAGHRLVLSTFGDLSRHEAASDVTDPTDITLHPDLVVLHDLAATATAAAEYQADFGAGWHATAGAAVEWRTGYGLATTPRAALVYLPWSWLSLRLAYAEGNRTPDRFDLVAMTQAVVAGRAVGAVENPSLRPEHARTLELAARLEPSARLQLEAALFGTRHEDAIEPRVVRARVTPQNLPPRLVLGGELSAGLEAVPSLLQLWTGLAAGRTVDGPALENHLAVLTAAIELTPLDGLALGGRSRFSWREADDAAAGLAAVAELYAAYRMLHDRVELSAVVRNALDGTEPSEDVAVLSGASDVAVPAPGRVLFVALEGRL